MTRIAKRIAIGITLALATGMLCRPVPALAADPAPLSRPAPEIGGPFTLVDQDGRTVRDTKFRGKWLLIYFGYTHCPDLCPTALTEMDAALSALDPARRAKVQPIFITVDPERDTPEVMKDYVGAFEGANIVGLTGSRAQITAAEAAYKIYAQRHAAKDGDYSMSHPVTIHVMDPDGRFVTLALPEKLSERLAQIVP
jgi:protein SCO1/2